MRTTIHRGRLALTVLAVLSIVVAGCAPTRQLRGTPEESGFLGDYSQLHKNPAYPAALVYFNPKAQWSHYNSIQIYSAGLWLKKDTNLSPEDEKKLTDALYEALHTELSKYFVISNTPGAHTLLLRAALTQAKGAKVAARVVTTVVPQLRMAGSVIGLVGNTATMVGSATGEMEILDSVTGDRLAAAVDDRAGTKVLFAKRAYTTWGDVVAACQYWSEAIAWRLGEVGVQLKPGATMPPKPKVSRTI